MRDWLYRLCFLIAFCIGCGGQDTTPDATPEPRLDSGSADTGPADAEPGTTPEDAMAPDAPTPDAEIMSRCGDGITDTERGEECDDGNDNDEDTCSNACIIRYNCPRRPTICDGASPTVSEHRLSELDPCAFTLVPEPLSETEARASVISDLAESLGPPLDVSDILTDLNRSGQNGVTNQTSTRLRNHRWRGFNWDDGDSEVDYWYPQGVTGSSDATASGSIDGQRVMMVSWYHRTDERPTKGARISIANTSDRTRVRYRHVLLVEPFRSAGIAQFRAANVESGDALHAGGIVWFGRYLYVADTRSGFRLYDLEQIMRVTHTDQKSRIGMTGTRADAHGYQYIVPEVLRYVTPEDSCPIKFSFAGLDRGSAPPTILTGEYQTPEVSGRVAAWTLDPSSGLLDVRDGEVRAVRAAATGQSRMQGALTWDGVFYISSSSQYSRWGRLYRTTPGRESRYSAWVYGCEDLYYERDTGVIWTAAEFPDFRDVVGIPMPSLSAE
jgi:cysteine-rich repeat protein